MSKIIFFSKKTLFSNFVDFFSVIQMILNRVVVANFNANNQKISFMNAFATVTMNGEMVDVSLVRVIFY